MRKGVILYFLVYVLQLSSTNDVENLRTMFYNSFDDEVQADRFLNYFETKDVKNYALHLGYNAVANFVQSKHAWNPYKKLEFFNVGKTQMELAVSKDTFSVELRFLRLSIQQNLPKFLGYSAEIDKDLQFILNHRSKIEDVDLKQRIDEYIELQNM